MIKRDTFLYMDGKGHSFAQCRTCEFWTSRHKCALMGRIVPADASCGLYVEVHGDSEEDQLASLDPKVIGYVERPVRCENCTWFHGGECGLYGELNRRAPAIFKLDTKVSATGCCNAQEPK